LLILAVSEGTLRVAHFGRDTRFFIPDELPGFYRTNPRFTELFFPASFGLKPFNFRLPKKKPAGSVRIFVIGESAAMGVPEPGFGLTPQLEAQLRAAYPGHEIHAYNLGITAINSHVIRRIVEEAASFEPDLFVIYMGNNEVVGPFGPSAAVANQMIPRSLIHLRLWLKASRVGQLIERCEVALAPRGHGFQDWRGMERFAGNTLDFNDPRMQQVYENFSANLHDILKTASEHGAKVVLSTVAVNLKFAPFVSRHPTTFSAAQQKQWNELELERIESTEFGEFDQANAALEKEEGLDPNFAESHFQHAELLTRASHFPEAAKEYEAALQLDALRFRADAPINAIIKQAAESDPQRIGFVDTAKTFESFSVSSANPEDPFFFEHVHFRWSGNFTLSRELALAAGQSLFHGPTRDLHWLSPQACADQLGYTPLGELAMLQRMDGLTDRPPFSEQSTFARERTRFALEIAQAESTIRTRETIENAMALLVKAQADHPENPFLITRLALVHSQLGDFNEALSLLDKLPAVEPSSAETAVARAYVLRALHRENEAENLLLKAAKEEPYYFQTYEVLFQLWTTTHQTEKAVAYFRALSKQMPDSSGIRMTYARLLNQTGDLAAAESECRAVLAFAPDDESALSAMVSLLNQRHQTDEALQLMLRAYHYNPHNFKNNERLVEVYDQRGDTAATVHYMQALAQSGSVNAALYHDLAQRLKQLGRIEEARVAEHRSEVAAEAESEQLFAPSGSAAQ
jgi:tetratricopeptide (TPR) repeat protein